MTFINQVCLAYVFLMVNLYIAFAFTETGVAAEGIFSALPAFALLDLSHAG